MKGMFGGHSKKPRFAHPSVAHFSLTPFFQSVASNGPLKQDSAQAALIGTPTPSRISAADGKKP